MSPQFGRCNLDEKPVDIEEFETARRFLEPYGPDAEGFFFKNNAGIIYRAFHTTRESRDELQPRALTSGALLTWDGRLDNREEIIAQLRSESLNGATDLAITAAAYEHWGTGCFAKMSGDWSLSVWSPTDRTLILARDVVGTRQLYYCVKEHEITWSTLLDPLLIFASQPFELEEEYIAGWLAFSPSTRLTPFVGIQSVPAASFVALNPERCTVRKYWEFDSRKQIRYRTDREYEEHFLEVFGNAVQRRLRSDGAILAELSGGVDSSSIVCMADTIMARSPALTPRVDTVSYYDEYEPNWNERPYFTAIERMRGRAGFRIDVSSETGIVPECDQDFLPLTPSAVNESLTGKQLRACLNLNGYRVLLSGIGGDEVLGGVPTPIPELADCLARLHLGTLAHQLVTWALVRRKPLLHLLAHTIRSFLPRAISATASRNEHVPWLAPQFAKRYRLATGGYRTRFTFFGPLPSFQESVATLEGVSRQLSCSFATSHPPCETRYPYLDRELLAFLFSIPREQLIRPHQRRSLMRRALIGIVPDQVLNRKRKAFVARAPLVRLSGQWTEVVALTENMITGSLGYVDPTSFLEALKKARQGQDVPIVPLILTLQTESWLRLLRGKGIITGAKRRGEHSGMRGYCRDGAVSRQFS